MSIKVHKIFFRYNESYVLRNISFEVSESEFIGLLGPNGSGKTTLLKLLIRLLTPEKGKITIFDKDISSYSRGELAKMIALVPQDTNVIFPYTSLEIVLMGRTPYLKGIGFESRRDVEIALKSMELTDTIHLANKQINNLSFGERQRVIIARALAQKPKIILLDEPNAHLDISHQIEIFSLLKKLSREEGLTVISVSHDINLISAYSDKLILLSDGEIFATGKPEDVLTEGNILNVYGTRVIVDKNPVTNLPRITLLPDKIGCVHKLKSKTEKSNEHLR